MPRALMYALLILTALVGAATAATTLVFFRDDGAIRPRTRAATSSSTGAAESTPLPEVTAPPTATPRVATSLPTRVVTATSTPRRIAAIDIRAIGAVNVRGGPGLTYPLVETLAPGARARATGRNLDASWLRVELPSVIGWVGAGVVETAGNPELLPLIEPVISATTTPAPTASRPNGGAATATPTTSAAPSPVRTPTPTPIPTSTATRVPVSPARGAGSTPPPAGASALPDLVLQAASIGPGGRLSLVIGNDGSVALTGQRVRVTGIDEIGDVLFGESTATLTIAPGGAAEVDLAFRPPPGTFTVVLNTDGAIDEISPANNVRRITVTPR